MPPSGGRRGLLDEHGIEARIVEYLVERPTREELERLVEMLGIDDPHAMVREGEPEYAALRLDGADRDAVLEAIVAQRRSSLDAVVVERRRDSRRGTSP